MKNVFPASSEPARTLRLVNADEREIEKLEAYERRSRATLALVPVLVAALFHRRVDEQGVAILVALLLATAGLLPYLAVRLRRRALEGRRDRVLNSGPGRVLLVISTLLLSAGCAMKGDVRRLQEEAAAQGALEEAQLQELAADIQALRELVEAQSAIAVDTQGGNARVFRDIQDQLSVLTQLVGQNLMLSERIEADGAPVTSTDPDSLGALVRRDGGDPAACDQIWQAAITQFNRGSNAAAQRGFSGFLRDCPEHGRATSAQFNLGDIAQQQDRLDDAIQEFLRVAQLDPLADRVPDALYRVGLIHVLQDNLNDAVIYFERVVTTYPEHDAADLARAELEDIR